MNNNDTNSNDNKAIRNITMEYYNLALVSTNTKIRKTSFVDKWMQTLQ